MDIEQYWSQYQLLRKATHHWSPLRQAVDWNTLSATIHPISYSLSGLFIKFMSLQIRDKDVMQKSVKCFAKFYIDNIGCCSLIRQHCNPIMKGHQICQTWFAVREVMLAMTNHLPIFHVPEYRYLDDLLHDHTGHSGEINWTVIPLVSLFLKKLRVLFPFSHYQGGSLDCHEFWSLRNFPNIHHENKEKPQGHTSLSIRSSKGFNKTVSLSDSTDAV